MRENEKGTLSISTVNLTEIAATPKNAIKFHVAIKNRKTNTLFLLTKEAVLEIELEEVIRQCKMGDAIILLTENKRYSLTHHEVEIIWGC